MVLSALDVADVECTRCAGVVLNSGKMAEAVSSGNSVRRCRSDDCRLRERGLRCPTEYYEDTAVELI